MKTTKLIINFDVKKILQNPYSSLADMKLVERKTLFDATVDSLKVSCLDLDNWFYVMTHNCETMIGNESILVSRLKKLGRGVIDFPGGSS